MERNKVAVRCSGGRRPNHVADRDIVFVFVIPASSAWTVADLAMLPSNVPFLWTTLLHFLVSSPNAKPRRPTDIIILDRS